MRPSLVRRLAELTLLVGLALGASAGPSAGEVPPAYRSFNFLVDLGGGTAQAGFSECSGVQQELRTGDFREGGQRPRSSALPARPSTITLRRGLVRHAAFSAWWSQSRALGVDARRTVVVKLLNPERTSVVATWRVRGALPLKYSGPTLTAKGGGDVAMEELVLSCEGLKAE